MRTTFPIHAPARWTAPFHWLRVGLTVFNRFWLWSLCWGILLFGCAFSLQARGLEIEWPVVMKSLSDIETGGNPKVVGAKGEITEYQILPDVWLAECKSARLQTTNHRNRKVANVIAWRVLNRRIATFQKVTKRKPSPPELYALWNAPGALEDKAYNWRALSPGVREKCVRFASVYVANGGRRRG